MTSIFQLYNHFAAGMVYKHAVSTERSVMRFSMDHVADHLAIYSANHSEKP
jgi:hypothetical protein